MASPVSSLSDDNDSYGLDDKEWNDILGRFAAPSQSQDEILEDLEDGLAKAHAKLDRNPYHPLTRARQRLDKAYDARTCGNKSMIDRHHDAVQRHLNAFSQQPCKDHFLQNICRDLQYGLDESRKGNRVFVNPSQDCVVTLRGQQFFLPKQA